MNLELDPDYIKIGCERIWAQDAHPTLFNPITNPEPISGHAARMTAWQRVARCRNSLSSKSLRTISVGTPSALLQVSVAHERVHCPPAGNGEIWGHVRELFRWWSKESEK